MQGYIISINKSRAEDLVVCVLTESRLKRLYRFYGARHSNINIGYKIDFSTESAQNRDIQRLRDVLHLGFSWLGDMRRMLAWQQFSQLLYKHLRDVDELERFYFDILDEYAHIFEKTNPNRVLLEAYTRLLNFEGRLHAENECFLCSNPLGESIAITRGFLPAHPSCVNQNGYERKKVDVLFGDYRTILFEDGEIDRLWSVLQSGM